MAAPSAAGAKSCGADRECEIFGHWCGDLSGDGGRKRNALALALTCAAQDGSRASRLRDAMVLRRGEEEPGGVVQLCLSTNCVKKSE